MRAIVRQYVVCTIAKYGYGKIQYVFSVNKSVALRYSNIWIAKWYSLQPWS